MILPKKTTINLRLPTKVATNEALNEIQDLYSDEWCLKICMLF